MKINKFPPRPSVESDQYQPLTGLSVMSALQGDPSADQLEAIKEHVLKHYGPTVRHEGLLEITSISRSNSYVLKKKDPTFPEGTPIYGGKNSPRWYWTHQVLDWLITRYNTFRNNKMKDAQV